MEINGFTIDKYNQYDFPENIKTHTCPICSDARKKKTDKCLQLFWTTGMAKCHHCDEVLQLHTFKSKEVKREYKKPEWLNETKLSDNLVKWFEGRGISQHVLRVAKITEGKEWMPQTKREENTIQFNYFRNNELINIKYRDGRKNFKMFKDAEKIFYNYDLAATDKEIIIVEGEMDVLSYMQAGIYNVVSVPNGSTIGNVNLEYLDNSIEIFANKDKFILSMDSDEAGQNVQKELIRRLGAEKCFLADLSDYKDANDLLQAKGVEALKLSIDNAKEIPITGISSVLDWEDEFKEYLVNGMKQGFKTGIESFDRIFSTYTGQYIVVTGKPSSGKSDFVDDICLRYNQLYGWKTAFASPENKPNKIHAGKLISKLAGKWVNKRSDLDTVWFNKAVNLMNDNLKFIDLDGSYDLDLVLDKAKQMIFKYGIKVLVIDPYNKVRLKESINKNVNDYTNDYLLKIDEFARKYDVLPILIAHPRKPSMGEAQTYEPTFYDIKGGGEFYDMSPHGLLVHRDYANEMVMIKVLKVKFSHLGENNAHTWLRWDSKCGRYLDFAEQNESAEQTTGLISDNTNWLDDKPIEQELQIPIQNNKGLEPVNFYEKDLSDIYETEDIPF
jgi:twinkle protein